MTTARDIIRRALQKNGVLTKNDALDGDEAADGLYALNAMLSSWSTNSLLVYTQAFESFALTAGQASYTMGSGGSFNTTRPVAIDSAFVRIGTTDYPLGVVNGADFDRFIVQKDTRAIPENITSDNGYPLTTIRLFPVPQSGQTLYMRTQKPLTSFATLDTAASLPDGWERALIYNLAVEVAPEYGATIDPATVEIARESKAAIKTATARNRSLDSYPQIGSGVDNLDGGWWI